MHGMDPRGGPSTGGGSSLVPLAAALGTMAPPGSRTILTRTTQTFVGGAAAPAASFSQLRTLAAQMSSEQTKIAEQAKDASDKLERAEAARKQLEGEVFQLQKQARLSMCVLTVARRPLMRVPVCISRWCWFAHSADQHSCREGEAVGEQRGAEAQGGGAADEPARAQRGGCQTRGASRVLCVHAPLVG